VEEVSDVAPLDFVLLAMVEFSLSLRDLRTLVCSLVKLAIRIDAWLSLRQFVL